MKTINFYFLADGGMDASMDISFEDYCEINKIETGVDRTSMSIHDSIMEKRQVQDYSGLEDDVVDYLIGTFIPNVRDCSKRLNRSKKEIEDVFLKLVEDNKIGQFTKDYHPLLSTPEQTICDTLEPLPRAVEMVVSKSNNSYVKKFLKEETGERYIVGNCRFFKSQYTPDKPKQLHHEAIMFTKNQTEKLGSDYEILATPISDQLLRKARDSLPKQGRTRIVVAGCYLDGKDGLRNLTIEDEGRIITNWESFLIPDVALALTKLGQAFPYIADSCRGDVSNPTPIAVLYPRMRNQMEEYTTRLSHGSNKEVNIFS